MAAAHLPEHASPSEPAPSARPLLILLIGLCSIFVFTYALRLDERDRMEAAIAAQEAANAEASARGAQLQQDLATAAGPAFLDRMVRTYIQWGKTGETRYVPINAPLVPASASAETAGPAPSAFPIWRQWIDLLAPGLLRR